MSITDLEEDDDSTKYITIFMPDLTSTYYLEAGVLSGIHAIEQSRDFDMLLGAKASVNAKNSAIAVLTGMIESIQEVQAAIIAERQTQPMPAAFNAQFAQNIIDGEDDS